MDNNVDIWFTSWEQVRSAIVSAIFFFCLIVALVRVLGKRATSQMNNFDWIINVTIGSLAASGILLKDVSISDATVAILVLSACQWLITWAVIHFPVVEKLVKAKPRLLTHKGQFLQAEMKKERIAEDEIRAKLREKGYWALHDANWVILESDGSMTIIPKQELKWSETEIMGDVDSPSNLD